MFYTFRFNKKESAALVADTLMRAHESANTGNGGVSPGDVASPNIRVGSGVMGGIKSSGIDRHAEFYHASPMSFHRVLALQDGGNVEQWRKFVEDAYQYAFDMKWMSKIVPEAHMLANTDEVRRQQDGKFRSVFGFKEAKQHFHLVKDAGHNDPSSTISVALTTWADGHPRGSMAPTLIMKVHILSLIEGTRQLHMWWYR